MAETFERNPRFPENLSCWILTDGKAGNETLCIGVADALGVQPQIKRVNPRGLSRLLAPYGPTDRHDRFGRAGSVFAAPWPDLAIACGRLTTPYIRALRRVSRLGTYTVVLLDPKTGPNSADLFWVPQHDKRRGPNVITTLTSPHRFSPERLEQLRGALPPAIAALPQPRVAVLIGGPNGDYAYSTADFDRLRVMLSDLAAMPVGLMVTCSRRTPDALVAVVEKATRRESGRVFWNGGDDNPYPNFLAGADAFLVTADSVNMVGEACVTGRPVHVFFPDGGSAKFTRYHDSLRSYGATRVASEANQLLETWRYDPLYSAPVIAAEIERRLLRRRACLGEGLGSGKGT